MERSDLISPLGSFHSSSSRRDQFVIGKFILHEVMVFTGLLIASPFQARLLLLYRPPRRILGDGRSPRPSFLRAFRRPGKAKQSGDRHEVNWLDTPKTSAAAGSSPAMPDREKPASVVAPLLYQVFDETKPGVGGVMDEGVYLGNAYSEMAVHFNRQTTSSCYQVETRRRRFRWKRPALLRSRDQERPFTPTQNSSSIPHPVSQRRQGLL